MAEKLTALIKQNSITHLLCAYVYLSSGLIINFLQFLTLPLWYLGYKETYRSLISKLNYLSWALIPSFAQWWAGIECYIYGHIDDITKFGNESAICILNHRGQLDWIISWIISDFCNILENAKCIVKQALAFVPILGFGFWFAEYIFLKRKLEQDKITLDNGFKNLSSFKENFWMLIFCEGTRYTPEKHKLSVEYANKNGLKPLKHHLLPRTKGFYLTVEGLRNRVTSVYDATVCFREREPLFTNLLEGKPCVADFMINRIPISHIPTDEKECAAYVHNLYLEKDELYEFHKKHNFFPIDNHIPKYQDFIRKKVDKSFLGLFLLIFWSTVTIIPLIQYAYWTLISGSTLQISIFISLIFLVIGLFYSMTQAAKPISNSGKSM